MFVERAYAWTACKTHPLPRVQLVEQGFVFDLKYDLYALLNDAIRDKTTESAVLLVARRGQVVYVSAVGSAKRESIFDLASLTKPIATAPAVLKLVDDRKLKLSDSVAKHLLWFARADKKPITIKQLLLHTSGLPAVVYRGPLTDGRGAILKRIAKARLRSAVGAKYRYSDIGYILLGEVVSARSGKDLHHRTAVDFYRSLGMCDTGFLPPPNRIKRVVTHWPTGDKRGQVYDPLAARLGGIAGHAGLFSTVDDLALFGQMLLNGGQLRGRRVLSLAAVRQLLEPQKIQGGRSRTLGFKVYRGPAVGHTGFTGTGIWIYPEQKLLVVLLTNRTRFEPAKSVGPLRERVQRLVQTSLLRAPKTPIRTGLDRLVAQDFASLRKKRVGLITNHAAVDQRGRFAGDLFANAKGVNLRALFAPEHGLRARADRPIKDGTFVASNGQKVPLFSLFGPRRRPPKKALEGIDVLVFDVPAVGVRYYTYLATMGWAMQTAARYKIGFVVLDRPNPLGAIAVQGPLSQVRKQTAANFHPLPIRYGMTVGELAWLFNKERRIGARLKVVGVKGWKRRQTFAQQGLPWVDPSPNIRSWRQALAYGATGLFEGTNVSVGRGTDSPFLWFGAPWIDPVFLARELNKRKLPGVVFVPETKTPRTSRYRGKKCPGVRLLILDPVAFRPVRTGIEIMVALRARHRKEWDTTRLGRMLAHPPTLKAILSGSTADAIVRSWGPKIGRFLRIRKRYLLY